MSTPTDPSAFPPEYHIREACDLVELAATRGERGDTIGSIAASGVAQAHAQIALAKYAAPPLMRAS